MAEKKVVSAQDKEVRKLRRRRSYIAGRLPELKEELGSLKNERKSFKDKEQLVGDPKSTDAKNLNRRRRFVKSRIENLQKEKEGLVAERKVMKATRGKSKGAEA
jgi:predicted  nucleic acid-binding Zn-ribbon protein